MRLISTIFHRPSKDMPNQFSLDHNKDVCDTTTVSVVGDNPIQRIEDDTIGRGPLARSFAHYVLTVDARDGFVVGVLGPWGSGKTSFINLAREEFRRAEVPVLDFNPWMFSGTQQLVESFFIELAAQLRIRPDLVEIGKDVEDYGEIFSGIAWLPLVGPWIERGHRLTKIASRILQHQKKGVGRRRAKLQKALADLRKPIILVLDDIDRLSTSEIRDMFRLVRLIANFPNVIYLVAFDRSRVETALAEQGVPGRDYLEKILQVAVDLPAIPEDVLSRQIISAIDAALAQVETPGPFDDQIWPDIFMELIRPLVRNMRDVRRYAAAIHGTVRTLGGQIALPDVLGLEAIRVFLPEVFASLHGAVDALTATSGFSDRGREEFSRSKAEIEKIINNAGEHGAVVRDMIERLFPAAQRHVGGSHYGGEWKGSWLKARRVAHEYILRLYLEGVAARGLQAFASAEQAWARMADRDALDRYLRSLGPEEWPDVISSLEMYEPQFTAPHVVPGVIVLLNILPEIPVSQRGMFELDSRFAVRRVTYRLLRSLNDPSAIEAAVRQILPEVRSLSAKLELIGQVGHREGRGHGLVSEEAAAEFERAWRNDVRATSVEDLVKEPDLLHILAVTSCEAHESEPGLNVDAAPELTLAILRSARREVRTQAMGSRAVHRSQRLSWDALIQLYGNEETLKERIESLKSAGLKGADEVLTLAEKYLGGWRPDEYRDE